MGTERQLTLRSYLLYRDGLLEEGEHSLVEKKASEANAVQRLEKRIRNLFSIHNGPSPGCKGNKQTTSSHCHPPTHVADYIDNALSMGQIGLFEINCFESDDLLAEVAECHRMLAVMRHDQSLKYSYPVAHATRIHELTQKKVARSHAKIVAPKQPVLDSAPEGSTAESVSDHQTRHDKWIIKRGENKSRPLEIDVVREQAMQGEITPNDLLWKYGGTEWHVAADLAESLRLEFRDTLVPSQRANPKRNLYEGLKQRRWRLLIAIGLCLPLLQTVFPTPSHTRPAQIQYIDGSVLPLGQLLIRFHPLARPQHAKTTPLPTEILVDPTSGDFQIPYRVADKITPHRPSHRVTLHRPNGEPLPGTLLSPDYSVSHKTPLQIHAEEDDTISLILMPPEMPDEQLQFELE